MNDLEESLEEVKKKEAHNDKMIEKTRNRLLLGILEPKDLSIEELENLALVIISNYGVISLAAAELSITEIKLRNIIAANPELQEIRKLATTQIKGLVDAKMIEAVKNGNADARDLLFKMMYSGRDKGGFNISELGSFGDDDADFEGKNKAAGKGNITVNIHFQDTEAKRASDFAVDDIDEYVDADFEDID